MSGMFCVFSQTQWECGFVSSRTGEITEEELLTRLQQVKDGGPRPDTGASTSPSPNANANANTSGSGGSSEARRPEATGKYIHS